MALNEKQTDTVLAGEATWPAAPASMRLDSDTLVEQVLPIPLATIHPSPLNARQSFSPTALAELTDSIRANGVLQPVVVREFGGGEFELVFGHRRTLAARAAGLAEIPAIVRQMTDAEVVVAQAIENLQREDLNAVDEARGYQQLLTTLGCSVEDLVPRVGRGRSQIYRRLRLLTASPALQAAVLSGQLEAETAQEIAAVPLAKAQEELVQEVMQGQPVWEDGRHIYTALSYRQAKALVRRSYKDLAKAVFSRTDAQLVPSAGDCLACPKRSGNDPALGEGEPTDLCRDTACFDRKEEAHYTAKKKALAAAGVKTLKSSESYDAEHKLRRGQLVDLDQPDPDIDPKRPLREVLAGHLKGAVALTDYDGSIKHVAMEPGALQQALKKAGIEQPSKAIAQAAKKAQASETTKQHKAPKQKAPARDLDRELEDLMRAQLVEAIATTGPLPGDLVDVADSLMGGYYSGITDAELKRAAGGVDLLKRPRKDEDIPQRLAQLDQRQLCRLVVALTLAVELEHNGPESRIVASLVRRYAIDTDALRAKVFGTPTEAAPAAKGKAKTTAQEKALAAAVNAAARAKKGKKSAPADAGEGDE